MAFALLIIGAVLLIAAVRGTTDGPSGLFALLKNDFTGQANFVYWIAAILIIGAIGYVPKLKSLSVAMLGLVVLVLFLKKGDPTTGIGGGFFAQLTSGLSSTVNPQSSSAVQTPTIPTPTSSTNTGPLSFPFLQPLSPLVQ